MDSFVLLQESRGNVYVHCRALHVAAAQPCLGSLSARTFVMHMCALTAGRCTINCCILSWSLQL